MYYAGVQCATYRAWHGAGLRVARHGAGVRLGVEQLQPPHRVPGLHQALGCEDKVSCARLVSTGVYWCLLVSTGVYTH